MTIQTDRVQEIFQDARLLQAAAVDRLDQGDIRDASEKAWGATKRSTDALVLARTGDEPERTPQTSTELRHLEGLDQDVRQAGLVARYYTRKAISTVSASTWASANLWPTLSAGSARRPTT